MDARKEKIFVGLSGGVDSAVSAALLLRAGADVTGVFIKGWYPPGMPCTWASDRRDAMRVAARLRIPFRTLDASTEYKREVIDYMLKEYRSGRTPNPDSMCNKEVKFGAFYRYARVAGATSIATGHYARIERGPSSVSLLRGVDQEKDQSYFLWAVPREVIAQAVFPLGGMRKKDVRALARRFNIPVAEKKDSQGICFLGNISVDEFLRAECGEMPGYAFDEHGHRVGKHDGVLLYTLGERVALRDTSETGPWFVYAKDVKENNLFVKKGHPLNPRADGGTTVFASANWFDEPSRATHAQYRYRSHPVRGHIENDRFVNETPLSDIPAPGQSIVFYRDDELIGGGIITSA